MHLFIRAKPTNSMNVAYTRHAEEKIAERKILKALIEEALKKPDSVLDSVFGRKITHKLIRDKLLRIVYEDKGDAFVIITAYYAEPDRYEALK